MRDKCHFVESNECLYKFIYLSRNIQIFEYIQIFVAHWSTKNYFSGDVGEQVEGEASLVLSGVLS